MDQGDENKTVSLPIEAKEFRRSNKAVAMRVARGGALTFLCRKIFNVMLYHTQKLGRPGENAPNDLPRFKKYYWVPLSVFTEDARFNSEAADYLSDRFENLMNIKLHCEDEGGVGSETLLAGFRITNRTGKRGDRRWVGWALPPSIEEMAMNPELYTTASLYCLMILKSNHALGLYETAKRYATSPGGVTMRRPVSWWHEVLRGVPVGTEMPEYKFFKRDVLLPAVAEVNLLSDVVVELVEFKQGRKVTELQFRVGEKRQAQLELAHHPALNMDLVQRLVDLGMLRREAEDIFSTHGAELLTMTLDLVDERCRNTNLPTVVSKVAFFRSALKNRYVEAAATANDKALSKRRLKAALPAAAEPNPAPLDSLKMALSRFDAMDVSTREQTIERIAARNATVVKMIRKNPSSKSARAMLAAELLAGEALTEVER